MKLFKKVMLLMKGKCLSILRKKKEDKMQKNMVYFQICKNVGSSYLSNKEDGGQK